MVKTSQRLLALDVMRGLTVALMILVNTPGSWEYIYSPLRHAAWHGCTPTDLVFPFFLFMVGSAMWYAFKKVGHRLNKEASRKIVKRSVVIFLIGLGINAFPFYNIDFQTLRIMGVLQRIGIAYGVASLLCLSLKKRPLIITSIVILLAYWGALLFWGGDVPFGKEGNWPRQMDLILLGEGHLWQGFGFPFDPEGLISTLPSIVTVILGYLAGSVIDTKGKEKGLRHLVLWGVLGVVVGTLWGLCFPINKALWTSSYVFYTAGWATLLLSLLLWLIDVKGFKSWTTPLLTFGMNPLFIYVLSMLWAKVLWMVPISGGTLYSWIWGELFRPWAGPLFGSFLFAFAHVVLFWGIGHILYKRKIFIKI